MKRLLVKLFLITSSIGFWYMILPDHYLTLIFYLISAMLIMIPVLAVLNYVVSALVMFLRKRYTWARRIFIDPRRY